MRSNVLPPRQWLYAELLDSCYWCTPGFSWCTFFRHACLGMVWTLLQGAFHVTRLSAGKCYSENLTVHIISASKHNWLLQLNTLSSFKMVLCIIERLTIMVTPRPCGLMVLCVCVCVFFFNVECACSKKIGLTLPTLHDWVKSCQDGWGYLSQNGESTCKQYCVFFILSVLEMKDMCLDCLVMIL